MSGTLDRDMRAMQAFAKLVDDAKLARRLFLDADMSIPGSLAKFLGEDESMRNPVWRAPTPPKRPVEAGEDWIWVKLKTLVPYELALWILRREKRTIPAVELSRIMIKEFLPSQNATSILNLGPRLEAAGLIVRSDTGWTLVDPAKAPVVYEKHGWGPTEVFQSQSVAAYRRMLIIDLLNIMPGGLQIMQIVEHLRAADFVRDPKPSKEVVTDDIEVLEKLGRVKRSGGKKWVLAGADKKEAKSTD